jgi:hypothetical protein
MWSKGIVIACFGQRWPCFVTCQTKCQMSFIHFLELTRHDGFYFKLMIYEDILNLH